MPNSIYFLYAVLLRSAASLGGVTTPTSFRGLKSGPRPVKILMWTSNMGQGPLDVSEAPYCTVDRAYEHAWKDEMPGQHHSRSFLRDLGVAEDELSVALDPDYDIHDVDLVWFNLAILMHVKDDSGAIKMPRVKPEGQLWVAYCAEPKYYDGQLGKAVDCHLLDDATVMARMDHIATYDNDAAFPVFFLPPAEELMRRPAPDFAARGAELLTITTSDCNSESRNLWMQGLLQALGGAALSYGRCYHSAEEPACDPADPEALQLPADTVVAKPWDPEFSLVKYANRCASRPFAFVAENTNSTPWYVTEKVWDALAVGAVPVYWGPPEVAQLLPAGSFLSAEDFGDAAQLAARLMAFDDADFARAREWKHRPTADWGLWERARALNRPNLGTRLCEAAAASPGPVSRRAAR